MYGMSVSIDRSPGMVVTDVTAMDSCTLSDHVLDVSTPVSEAASDLPSRVADISLSDAQVSANHSVITTSNYTSKLPLTTTTTSSKSLVSSSSLIKTLHPFTTNHASTRTNTTYTASRPRSSTKARSSPCTPATFDNLFGPQSWTKYFTVTSDTPITNNDLDLHLCLLKQVGKDIVFTSRNDGSKIITVQTEKQALAMKSLVDPSGAPVPAARDLNLNSCICTVLVPLTISLGNRPWDSCSPDIKSILEYQDLKILQVDCYVIPPTSNRKYPVRIAKIRFDTRTPPTSVIIGGTKLPVKPFIRMPSVNIAGSTGIQQSTADLHCPASFVLPHFTRPNLALKIIYVAPTAMIITLPLAISAHYIYLNQRSSVFSSLMVLVVGKHVKKPDDEASTLLVDCTLLL